MKKEIKLTTKCRHQFNHQQMRQFNRDQCRICNKWVHKEEIIKILIKQIENNLADIKKLN